jgi:hypothetical protein
LAKDLQLCALLSGDVQWKFKNQIQRLQEEITGTEFKNVRTM